MAIDDGDTIGPWVEAERTGIEGALEARLPAAAAAPAGLHRAMRYSVLGGGKRLRPMLCRAAARAVAGADVEAALGPACAVEMIHAYSPIHDDLPALDNDDLRRGRPTCHKAFGEAMAILAGDALLTLAFAQLATAKAEAVGPMLAELSRAAGTPSGMVAGQVADLEATRMAACPESVREIHRFKTAAMIRAAVVLGGLAAGAGEGALGDLRSFGEEIGLAFQIVDDILDVTGAAAELGKSAGKDEAAAKATYPAIMGLAASRAEAERLRQQANGRLARFGAAGERLRYLAGQMVDRVR